MSETYSRVQSTLGRFMSQGNASAILAVACRRLETTPADLGPDRLEALLQEISNGIRLFCPEDRFAEMMLALARLAD